MPSQVRTENMDKGKALEEAKIKAAKQCGSKKVKEHGNPSFSQPYGKDQEWVCDYWFECE
ncbi:MAG: hypothetical protein QNK37_04965 [Acidobacteriota bacterium]|nr:hypothetical protein [Acidobacteriota bacterium]